MQNTFSHQFPEKKKEKRKWHKKNKKKLSHSRKEKIWNKCIHKYWWLMATGYLKEAMCNETVLVCTAATFVHLRQLASFRFLIRELHFFHIILCQWSFAGVRFMPLFMCTNNQNDWRLNKLQLDWTSVFERVQVSLSGEEG